MLDNIVGDKNKVSSLDFRWRQVGMRDFSLFIHFGKDFFDIHFNDKAAA